MDSLVIELDNRLKLRLDALAARSRKPLSEWAAEQLGHLAISADVGSAGTYSAEWLAAFGSILDPSFVAPARSCAPKRGLDFLNICLGKCESPSK
jgi:hypothetical protein